MILMKSVETVEKQNILIEYAYHKYYETLLSYVYKRIKDYEESRDIVHDIFIRMIGMKNVLYKTTLKRLLFTIAQNIIIDKSRQISRETNILSYIKSQKVYEDLFPESLWDYR